MLTLKCLVLTLLLCACDQSYEFNPARLTIVNPYSSSGSSSIAIKAIQMQLSNALGETVYVQSIPGNGGQVGATAFWEADHNDRVMFSTTAKSVEDWGIPLDHLEIFPIWSDVAVISVSADSEIKEVVDIFTRNRPVKVMTAGKSSSGYLGLMTVHRLWAFDYEMESQDSGTEAALAVASGEGDIVIQLFSEQRSLIESGDLVPLAVISNEPFEYKDINIPSVSDFLHTGVPTSRTTFALMVPADSSNEFIDKLRGAWRSIDVDRAAQLAGTVPATDDEDPKLRIEQEIDADRWAKN